MSMTSSEFLSYALVTFGLVLVAIVLSSLLARWWLRRGLRARFSPLPFIYEAPWGTHIRSRWGRLKARVRRWWKR